MVGGKWAGRSGWRDGVRWAGSGYCGGWAGRSSGRWGGQVTDTHTHTLRYTHAYTQVHTPTQTRTHIQVAAGPKQGQAWEGNRWKLYIKNNSPVIKLIVESYLLFNF